MAEGEINIDNLIQRLLEGQFLTKISERFLFVVVGNGENVFIQSSPMTIWQADKTNFVFTKKKFKLIFYFFKKL